MSYLSALEIVELLGLKPHPLEGGFYNEHYRSQLTVSVHEESTGSSYERAASTSIYYLITQGHFSPLHRVKHDELWHFYMGSEAEMIQISESGKLTKFRMGNKIEKGELLEVVVPAGTWESVRLCRGGEWSLFGITVAPGFDYKDITMGKADVLTKQFPEHRELIEELTR